jgi:hypothetical protein
MYKGLWHIVPRVIRHPEDEPQRAVRPPYSLTIQTHDLRGHSRLGRTPRFIALAPVILVAALSAIALPSLAQPIAPPTAVPISVGAVSVDPLLSLGTPATARAPPPTFSTNVSVNPSRVVGYANAEFWGVDLDTTHVLNATETQQLNATGVDYQLWPGGKMNDWLDMLTNTVHYPNGTTASPKEDIQQFAQWCKSTRCHAIIGLPGEINDSVLAASEVGYIEGTLHFHPTFWEIGNEPGLWVDYDLPWSAWTATSAAKVTALQYAILVKGYVTAIHAVDPSARIVGLPGTGLGSYDEPTWVYDTLLVNQHTIAAIGLHVYPAGHLSALTGNLTEFDDALSGKGGIDTRIPLVRQQMAQACRTCHPQLLVTEFNAATVGAVGNVGSYATFMDGFDNVPFVAAGAAQALDHRIRNLDLWDFASGYPGALFASNDTPRPLYYLYSQMFVHLEPTAINTTFSGSLGEFFGIATTATSSGQTHLVLLLANANPTQSVRVHFASLGLPTGTSTVDWRFTSTMGQPTQTTYSGAPPGSITLAAESVVVISFTY